MGNVNNCQDVQTILCWLEKNTLYITNFQTSKVPTQYTVQIWRTSKNFMVGSFTFKTVK